MSTVELFILAVGLSMDAFAVSICKGLSLQKVTFKDMAIVGAWFGGFQALMPLIGYYVGNLFADFVSTYSAWIAFALLLYIGITMIRESRETEKVDAGLDPKTMFIMAIATSIDALAVGVSFAFLRINIYYAVLFIGVITFVLSAIGVKVGSVFGARYKSKAEILGGVVLIAIGIKILIESFL